MAWARPLRDPDASPRAKPRAYQGIAQHPHNPKIRKYKTFKLKGQAETWAEEIEAAWRRDSRFDPTAGEVRFADWVTRWQESRFVGAETAKQDASLLRCHLKPQWDEWRLSGIDRLDVGAWIKTMERDGVGANTIASAVHLFSVIMGAAVETDRIPKNPATKQKLPTVPPVPPKFFTKAECARILAELAEPWRTACAFDIATGLRIGELLGLRAGRVDWARAEVMVLGAMSRSGWREYPKSRKSFRMVKIPPDLLDALAPMVVGRPADAFVFPAPDGGPMTDVNFRNRIWNPAVALAGACATHRDEGKRATGCRGCKLTDRPGRPCPAHRRTVAAHDDCERCKPVPQESPHTMRHTAASRLVMEGVDIYRVQALLGHESVTTTERYSHLRPDAQDRILEAWKSLGASQVLPTAEAPLPEGEKGL